MDINTKIALNKYLKFKGFQTKWVMDENNCQFAYNLNIHHEDRDSGLDLNAKNFREIANELISADIANMDLETKEFVLSLHTNTDEEGYKQTFLYYNLESNGKTILRVDGGRPQLTYPSESCSDTDIEKRAKFSDQEIKRMSHLLKQIEKARLELAEIQYFYSTCSINYVCEPASYIVEKILGDKIMWTN